VGVLVGGTGVRVGGTSVGLGLGGTGVSVGVLVGGTGVRVGGTGVALGIGGTGVSVSVGVAVGVADGLGVWVAVPVGVMVGVFVGVRVGVGQGVIGLSTNPVQPDPGGLNEKDPGTTVGLSERGCPAMAGRGVDSGGWTGTVFPHAPTAAISATTVRTGATDFGMREHHQESVYRIIAKRLLVVARPFTIS
jgi:hypothetical protein